MYTLPPLPYHYTDLEPYIDARTMELHYTKHHQTYIDNLNKALAEHPHFQEVPLNELLSNLAAVPDSIRTAVRNHGGGHYNHTLFWTMMRKGGGGAPKGQIGVEILKQFASFEHFQTQFNTAAKGVFGSGWAWLVLDKSGNLAVTSTPNQDTTLGNKQVPLLGLDVWEHAYYLKYQNRRVDYIDAFWHVVNWDQVEENYRNAI